MRVFFNEIDNLQFFRKCGCIKVSLFVFKNTICSVEKNFSKNVKKIFDIFLKIQFNNLASTDRVRCKRRANIGKKLVFQKRKNIFKIFENNAKNQLTNKMPYDIISRLSIAKQHSKNCRSSSSRLKIEQKEMN